MRWSWSLGLLGLLLLCGTGCEGDSCGPTSDWPTCGTPPPSGASPDEGSNEPPRGNPGSTDGSPSLGLDAGSAAHPMDAGVDASDASDVTSFDGDVEACVIDPNGRRQGDPFDYIDLRSCAR